MNDNNPSGTSREISCKYSFVTFLISAVVLCVINYFTQPYEESIGKFHSAMPFYLDYVWYLDDIIGPSIFLTAGLTLLRRIQFRLSSWPVAGLALTCIAFAAGDTIDAHWVFPQGAAAADLTVSFSSWMSKIMVVITFCIFIVLAYDAFERKAQKALLIGFFLLFIDQIQMSISFDFAGYAFHVFEEILEVITGLCFCIGVACRRMDLDRLKSSSTE